MTSSENNPCAFTTRVFELTAVTILYLLEHLAGINMRPRVQSPSAETLGKSACGLGHELCTAGLPYIKPHDVDTR